MTKYPDTTVEQPDSNDYLISVCLDSVSKGVALALAERISRVIDQEFKKNVNSYGITAGHVKEYIFGWPGESSKTQRSSPTLES